MTKLMFSRRNVHHLNYSIANVYLYTAATDLVDLPHICFNHIKLQAGNPVIYFFKSDISYICCILQADFTKLFFFFKETSYS